jgi:hypothetical protein
MRQEKAQFRLLSICDDRLCRVKEVKRVERQQEASQNLLSLIGVQYDEESYLILSYSYRDTHVLSP